MKEQPLVPNHDESHEAKRVPDVYREALDAVRTLREAGVTDPNAAEQEKVQGAYDAIDHWQSQCGVQTVEQAQNLVKAATIWLDAGYEGERFLKEAIECLATERSYALRDKEVSEEIVTILETAVQELEERLAMLNVKETIATRIASAVEDSKQKVRAGDRVDALRLLTSTLQDQRHRSFFKKHAEQEAEIRKLRDFIRNGGDLDQF